MALEWKKPGKEKPEMVIRLEELRSAAEAAIRQLKEKKEELLKKEAEDKDGEVGK
jgi:hypothetical protein